MANSVVRLSIDSHEFDANIKRAGEALNKFFDQSKKGDRTFEELDDDVMEVVKAFGSMETKSKSAKGQLAELTKGFTDFGLAYKQLTAAEKASPVGQEMAKQLDILKGRIDTTKKNLAEINQELSGSKFGQFGSLIDSVGRQMGINANITELLTSKTALMTAGIGAGIAIVGKATSEWKKYNDELAKQDQITTVTTGLKGTEADGMTDSARALADTYKVDFRQAIDAAKALMTQFGQTGDQAMQLLRDGMQGMIRGDGPKMLNMIKQYAPAFRDAGVSASQLVAVIHNTEGGIFTDQNMNAIVMGIKNIRLMTKATNDALAKLGIDGQKMTQQLNDGTITVFDALKQVAGKLREVDSNSQTAGAVMQSVFGRSGVTAGTNIATAIETLNTNLEETKRQTGEVGEAFADLQIANEKLNTAIRDAFSYDGWDQMATGIKSTLISALADVIDKLGEIRGLMVGISPGQAKREKYGTSGTPEEVTRDIERLRSLPMEEREQTYQQMRRKYEKRYSASVNEEQRAETEYEKGNRGNLLQRYNPLNMIGQGFARNAVESARSRVQADEEVLNEFNKLAKEAMKDRPSARNHDPGNNSPDNSKNKQPKTELQQNQQAIAKLTEEYQDLATAAKTADEAQQAGIGQRMTDIRTEISQLQARNEELKKFAQEAQSAQYPTGSLPQLTQQLKDLQQEQAKALTGSEWQEYQRQIEQTTEKIAILKGQLKKGEEAEYTIEVDKSKLESLLMSIPADDETIRVNVEAGSVNLPEVPTDDETIRVNVIATTSDAVQTINELVQGYDGVEVSVRPVIKDPDLRTPLERLQDQLRIKVAEHNVEVDTTFLTTLLEDAIKNNIDVGTLGLNDIAYDISANVDVSEEQWKAILEKYNELREQIGEEPIEIDFSTGKQKDSAKDMKGDWKDAAGAVQSLGAALQGIEDPAAKVVGIVAQAIATVALTFSKSLAGTVGPWDWIAAAVAGTATMISTITAIKSATKGGFAEGGIVPGNSYSGDLLRTSDYGINSGELILNKAQQDNVASQLMGGDSVGSVSTLPYVTGEKIVLGINNWGRSTGRGQLVFSKS